MNNVTRFPFQLHEPINAHGYSMEGKLLHVKVLFIRYIEDDACFDCVIECEGTKSRANTHSLWRDGDPVPNIDNSDTIDVSCIPSLTEEELATLQEGDVLVHNMTDHEIEIVSTKEAPAEYRVRCTEDGKYRYFNYGSASISLHHLK